MPLKPRWKVISLLAAVGCAAASPAFAQQQPPPPYKEMTEHKTTLDHFRRLGNDRGAVGLAARHVLAIMIPHDQREEQFVLPLLSLTATVVDGKVGPELAWAIPMTDRLAAERSTLFSEHAAIIGALTELTDAARARHDLNLMAFAEQVAMDEVNDGEFVYPSALLVGSVIRAKLTQK